MNPFDLHGPEFLVFYVVFAVLVVGCAAYFRRAREAGPAPALSLDPYTIACLRGGKNEVLRVAMVSLIDRGLLAVENASVVRPPRVDPASARHAVERAVLQRFGTAGKPETLFSDQALATACEPFETTLAEHALLPDAATRQGRRTIFQIALLFLCGVALAKLFIALSRGRHNVGLLIVLMLVAVAAAAAACFPRLTQRGKAMLEDLRMLYLGLRERSATIRPGGASIEAAMLAAVFGIAALPAASFDYAQKLFPRAATGNSSPPGAEPLAVLPVEAPAAAAVAVAAEAAEADARRDGGRSRRHRLAPRPCRGHPRKSGPHRRGRVDRG